MRLSQPLWGGFRPKDGRRAQGFTLLELLVSLTLLSLIGLIMLGGLRLGERTWERGASIADRAEMIDAAQRVLRRELSNIYPLWQAGAANQGKVLFEGTATSLTFIAPAAVQSGLAPRQQFRLALDAAGLQLEWRDMELWGHYTKLTRASSAWNRLGR